MKMWKGDVISSPNDCSIVQHPFEWIFGKNNGTFLPEIHQEIGGKNEGLDMSNSEQSDMIKDERLYVVEQDIPLHMLRDQTDTVSGDIPFMHFKFSDEIPGSLVSYPHRRSFYEIPYVTGGNATHFIDFHAHPIEPNTSYFITPRQVHHWETAGQAIEGEILLFTKDFFIACRR